MSFWSERTLRRSFACVARKMRCLRLRTSRSASRQSMTSQIGPSLGSVCLAGALHLTCPLVGILSQRSAGDSPDPRQRPFGLGQRPYPPGYGFPVPFGGRHSLLGSSCARCGVGPSFRRSSGLLAEARPQRGCRVPHQMRCDGGGCLLYCGAGVSLTGLRLGAGPMAHIAVFATASFAYAASMKVHSRSPFPSFPGNKARET